MIFTRHAYERYREFHMLDRPTATDEDARVVLDAHANDAVRLPGRTIRGDEVWTIHALGIELVVKRDPEPLCVTVLPPERFRGLTPLQVERLLASAREAEERAAAAKRQLLDAQVALVAQREVTKEAARKVNATRQASAQAEAVNRKALAAQAAREHEERITQAQHAATLALAEHHLLLSVLKTMRAQLAREHEALSHKAALRIALRHLRSVAATETLDAIEKLEPGLVSDKFIDAEDLP